MDVEAVDVEAEVVTAADDVDAVALTAESVVAEAAVAEAEAVNAEVVVKVSESVDAERASGIGGLILARLNAADACSAKIDSS